MKPSTAVLALVLWAGSASAQGGPPLRTDDPDTPGPNHWEINLAILLEKDRLERRIETPRLDLNYGVGRRIQLKIEMPWVFVRESGARTNGGAGDATAGVKWRFIGEEGTRIAWAVYPQFEFNTSSASARKGIVDSERQLLLPTEATLEFRKIEINLEAGRNLVWGGPNGWIYGVSTELTLIHRFELLGEIRGEETDGRGTELFVDVGGRQKLTEKVVLLFAAGRTVHDIPSVGARVYAYAGLQFNLPNQYVFTPPPAGIK